MRYLSVGRMQRHSGILNCSFSSDESKTENSCIILRFLIPKYKIFGTDDLSSAL